MNQEGSFVDKEGSFVDKEGCFVDKEGCFVSNKDLAGANVEDCCGVQLNFLFCSVWRGLDLAFHHHAHPFMYHI